MLNTGDILAGGVHGRLHRCDCAAAKETVGGDDGFGAGVRQPRHDGAVPVAAEQRQDDAADLDDGEKGNCQLRDHRHIQPDSVALAQTQRTQGIGAAVDLGVQLGVGEGAHRAALAFPAQGDAFPRGRRLPLVQTVVDDVELAAHTPARKFDAVAEIDYL